MGREDKYGGHLIQRRIAIVEDLIIQAMRKIITGVSIMMIHKMKRSVVLLYFLSMNQHLIHTLLLQGLKKNRVYEIILFYDLHFRMGSIYPRIKMGIEV